MCHFELFHGLTRSHWKGWGRKGRGGKEAELQPLGKPQRQTDKWEVRGKTYPIVILNLRTNWTEMKSNTNKNKELIK